MIILFAFELIQLAYTDLFIQNQHILVEDQSGGVKLVVKDGQKIRKLFQKMYQMKVKMKTQSKTNSLIQDPIFISFTQKSKKNIEHIYRLLCQNFQSTLLYINQDKQNFSNVPINRAQLIGREITYGQGYHQLRPKEQLRIAISSLFNVRPQDMIFFEKNNEAKQLKKEGFTNILTTIDIQQFEKIYQERNQAIHSAKMISQQYQILMQKFPFASNYLKKLNQKNQKQIQNKQIVQFKLQQLKEGPIPDLYNLPMHFSIVLKSWVEHSKSKEICSFVFKNITDHRLYLARANKPKQYASQEDCQNKVFAHHLNYIIGSLSYSIPHYKFNSITKFCKVKAYQNKKAFLNIRPYIEGLQTVKQFASPSQMEEIIRFGTFRSKKIKGMGQIILLSLLMNEKFEVKSFADQITFLIEDIKTSTLTLFKQQSLKHDVQVIACRTDFYDAFDITSYKLFSDQLIVANFHQNQYRQSLKNLSQTAISQMVKLIQSIKNQRYQFVKGLCRYYGWEYHKKDLLNIIQHRLKIVEQFLSNLKQNIQVQNQQLLLLKWPRAIGLLTSENYEFFISKQKKMHYCEIDENEPISLNQFKIQEQQIKNPYLQNVYKSASFCIFSICFQINSFLQWIKSTSKYTVIIYMSMLNHNIDKYMTIDMRLKLLIANEKKSAILVVDHVQMYPQMVQRQRNCKTVFISRYKKIKIQNLTTIYSQYQNQGRFNQNKDELVSILFEKAKGLESFKATKDFKLYEWVLLKYIQIKCCLYGLDYQTAIQFLRILHSNITSQKNRIKQLQQMHSHHYKYLYVYPIHKVQQKILFCNNLYAFLHAKYLLQSILKNKWSFRLETKQNSSVAEFRDSIQVQTRLQIIQKLKQALRSETILQNSNQQMISKENDILELICSLIKPNKQQNLSSIDKRLAYQYCSLFPAQTIVKNYQNIIYNQKIQGCLIVLSQDQLSINDNFHHRTVTLPFNIKSNEIFIDPINSFLIIVDGNQKQLKIISYVLCEQKNSININQYSTMPANAQLMKLIKQRLHKIKCLIIKGSIFFVSVEKNMVKLIKYNQNLYKQEIFKFESCVIDYLFTVENESQLCIIITETQIRTISLSDQKFISNQISMPQSINNRSKVIQENHQIIIISHVNNCAKIFMIDTLNKKLTTMSQLKLQKNIRALYYFKHMLFVFYIADESLYVYKICNDLQIDKRLCKYYWIDEYCNNINIIQDVLFLSGEYSYVKTLRLEIHNSQ